MTRPFFLLSACLLAAPAIGAPAQQGDFMSSHYPPTALKNGEEGKVGFRVDVSAEGRIEQCAITESSGYPALDRETCDFIVQYAGFGPARDAKGKAQPSTKMGRIVWTLPAGVAKSNAPRMASAALPPPLICKRGGVTGSALVKLTRYMTEEEWRQHEKIVREEVEGVMGRIICTDHGCVG